MALPLDENSLVQFIKDAETLRDKHLEFFRDLIQHYTGISWRTDSKGKPTPENYPFAYVSFLLPQLVFEAPTVSVTARRAVQDAKIAEAVEMALNAWIAESEFVTTLERVTQLSIMGYGVTKVGLEVEGDDGAMGPRLVDEKNPRSSKPTCDVLGPGQYFRDPLCGHTHKPRYEGHTFQKDLEDLKSDPRYDQSVVETLQPNDQTIKQPDSPFEIAEFANTIRPEVTLYEVYIPEVRKLITLAKLGENSAKIIRKTDYYGPKEGPYRLWGMYVVPGQVYPLSPLAATFEQFLELQDHATAAGEEAATFKSFVAYDLKTPGDGKKAMDVQNGGVQGFENIDGIKTVTVGGTGPQRADYIQVLRQRLDRVMGYTDAQRGMTGAGTATEADISQSNSDLRVEWMRRQIRKDAKAALESVGWYLFSEPSVTMHVSTLDKMTGKAKQFMYIGGFEYGGKKQTDQDWVHYRLDIEPYSMQKVDNALLQKRAQDVLTILPNLLPVIQQFPQINWRKILDWFGETVNTKKFSDMVFGDGQSQNQFAPLLAPPAPPPGMPAPGGMMPGPGGPGPAGLPSGVPPQAMLKMLLAEKARRQGGGGNGAPASNAPHLNRAGIASGAGLRANALAGPAHQLA